MPTRTYEEWARLLIVVEASKKYHQHTTHQHDEHHERRKTHARLSIRVRIVHVVGNEIEFKT